MSLQESVFLGNVSARKGISIKAFAFRKGVGGGWASARG